MSADQRCLTRLIQETRAACVAAGQRHPQVSGELGVVVSALDQARPVAAGSAVPELPVQIVQSLETAARRTGNTATGALARAVGDAASFLHWHTSRETAGPPERLAFKKGYAFCALMGKGHPGEEFVPLFSEDVLLGFAIQGRDTFYPPHAHRAAEIYGVLSGTAEWMRGAEWQTRVPGEFFVHAPFQDHAMRTAGAPMLTIWAWIGLSPEGRA